MVGKGVSRYGCNLAEYLDQHDQENHSLPRYLVRIRTGNKESFEFLKGDEERASFHQEYDLSEGDSSGAIIKGTNKEGLQVQQRIYRRNL